MKPSQTISSHYWRTSEHRIAQDLRDQGQTYRAIGLQIGRTANAVAARLRYTREMEKREI